MRWAPKRAILVLTGHVWRQVVLLDDVDFIVSPGVVGPQQYEAIVQRTRARQALVLPALEPYEEVVGIEKGIQQTVQALAGEPSSQRNRWSNQQAGPGLSVTAGLATSSASLSVPSLQLLHWPRLQLSKLRLNTTARW